MLPIFYSESLQESDESTVLDEDTSKHIVQVLRMRMGEHLQVTSGKGSVFTAEITEDHKKKVKVRIIDIAHFEKASRRTTIAISLLKNTNRFEWFLEKATEIGVSEIIPMICERTERQHFRAARMKNILVSAMLQSRQGWLPQLQDPLSYKKVVESANQSQKFMAHCMEGQKNKLTDIIGASDTDRIILIGPEGDFTKDEVEMALRNNFLATSLGDTRLRSETAGVVAATLMQLGN